MRMQKINAKERQIHTELSEAFETSYLFSMAKTQRNLIKHGTYSSKNKV